LLKANIDGPEPEIPEPKSPFSNDVYLILSNFGMKGPRKGSTITSFRERPINS
jgi:hypothetical protein